MNSQEPRGPVNWPETVRATVAAVAFLFLVMFLCNVILSLGGHVPVWPWK